MGISGAQFNSILWALWGQGTQRLTHERPNGEAVTDQSERVWRYRAVHSRPEDCPHWPAYRTCAEPLVTELARQQFAGQPDEEALLLLFRQLQSQPLTVVPALRRLSQHADLDQIIEAEVWPWLEGESAARDTSEQGLGHSPGLAPQGTTKLPCNRQDPLRFREQITPLATLAYRIHELGTQVAYLANRQLGGEPDAQPRTLDERSGRDLATCSDALIRHAAYSRACAIQVRNTAMLSDRIAQIGQGASTTTNDGDHQWWIDLTTRPITSEVRDEVSEVSGAEQLAALLMRLADESDALVDDLGNAFERVGWSRGIASGTTWIGPELRSISERLSATDSPSDDR